MTKIIQPLSSVNTLATQLDGLSQAMGRCNFGIGFALWGFKLLQTKTFTIDLLEELVMNDPIVIEKQKNFIGIFPHIVGTLKIATLNEFEDAVEGVLFWSSKSNLRTDTVATSIRTIFFDIINRALVHKPLYVLQHHPSPGSYFDNSGLFSMCFILMTENHGIIISGSSAA